MPNKDLKKRTTGERFWLLRLHYGLKQVEVARELGVSERAYNHIERDMRTSPKRPGAHPGLTKGALCALARRRDGRPLRKLAKVLGTSHVTLLLWERTSHPALVKAWKRLGYEF